jgi:serine O-acetyltransferase
MPIEPPPSPSWIEATGPPASNSSPAPLPPLRTLLAADLRANAHGVAPGAGWWLRALARNLPTVRFCAVVLLRFAQKTGRRVGLLGSWLKQLNHFLYGCDIAWQADIGPGLILFHPTGVVVGPACTLGAHAALMQGVTLGSTPGGSPTIGANVFVGPGACVLGPVTVGDDVIVGANAVVVEAVAAGTVVGGIPARVLRQRQQ